MKRLTLDEIQDRIFNKWKKSLDEIHIEYSFDDFLTLDADIRHGYRKFKNTATYSVDFYKERYFMLDYISIHENRTSQLKEKRGSIYDVELVAAKKNISIEQAQEVVNNRKFLTSGSIDTYIHRYGEVLGPQKYNEFSKKCIITRDSLIEKHGSELGEKKWLNYCNTRDSGSYEYFLRKNNYDAELAKLEHDEYKKIFSISSSNAYLLEKYGQEFVETLSFKKGYQSTLEYFVTTYGKHEGEEKYKELNSRKKITKEKLIEVHGEELGTIKFENWKESLYRSTVNRSHISKQSINLFKVLEKKLGRKLIYGSKKDELCLKNQEDDKMYFYDCYDETTNTIIEYNGSLWHPSPKLNEDERLSWRLGGYNNTMTYYEALEKDTRKNNYAINNGYKLIVVWDYEINSKIKLNNTVTYLIGELNG